MTMMAKHALKFMPGISKKLELIFNELYYNAF